MLLSSLFDDSHSGLVEILAWFFPLILWWTVGRENRDLRQLLWHRHRMVPPLAVDS